MNCGSTVSLRKYRSIVRVPNSSTFCKYYPGVGSPQLLVSPFMIHCYFGSLTCSLSPRQVLRVPGCVLCAAEHPVVVGAGRALRLLRAAC